MIEGDNKKLFNTFSAEHLKPDVVMVFRLLSNNVNGMVVSELVKKMWDTYCQNAHHHMDQEMKIKVAQDSNSEVFDSDTGSDNVPKFPLGNGNGSRHSHSSREGQADNRSKLVVRVNSNGKQKSPTSSV